MRPGPRVWLRSDDQRASACSYPDSILVVRGQLQQTAQCHDDVNLAPTEG